MRFSRLLTCVLLGWTLQSCGVEEAELPAPRTVLVETVELSGVMGRRFSGQLQAADRSDLAFEVGGVVRAIHVDLGSAFKQGDVLAELDDRELLLALSAREAALVDAEATLVDARRDYERRASLKGTGAVSQSAIDRAQAVLERAEAQVQVRQSEVERAKDRVDDAQLIAPFDGEVTQRMAEPSEVAGIGAPVLRIVGTGSNLEAIVSVSAAARRDLNVGQPTEIDVLAHDTRVSGVITEIGAQANVAGLFPITIALNEALASASPGESIEAIFLNPDNVQQVQIPHTAYIQTDPGTGLVYTVVPSPSPEAAPYQVKSVEVVLGELHDGGIQILDGLALGDVIITKGVDLLTADELVYTTGGDAALKRYNQ